METQRLQVFSSVGITVILLQRSSNNNHALCNVRGQRESSSVERGSDSRQGVIRDKEELIRTLLVCMLVSDAEQIAVGCWVDQEGISGPLLEV